MMTEEIHLSYSEILKTPVRDLLMLRELLDEIREFKKKQLEEIEQANAHERR